MQRYNIQTHPQLADMTCTARPVTYSRHAHDRARTKRVPLLPIIAVDAGDVVEAEESYGRLSKVVVRQRLDARRDRVLVLVPDGDRWFCVTVWANDVNDKHATLNLGRVTGART
jgi:hypothetical protein